MTTPVIAGRRQSHQAGLTVLLLSTTTVAGLAWLGWNGELSAPSVLAVTAVGLSGIVAGLMGRKRGHAADAAAVQLLSEAAIDRAQALLVVTDAKGRMIL